MSHSARKRSDLLAAEFVLGCLPRERVAEVRRRCGEDRDFAATVEVWQQRLFPLARALPPEAPPSEVWARIERRLPAEKVEDLAGRVGKPALWSPFLAAGGFGLAAALALVVLVSSNLLPLNDHSGALTVSKLSTTDGETSWRFDFDTEARTLTIQRHGAPLPAGDHDLELWLIAPDGSLRSLGLIPDAAEAELSVGSSSFETLAPGASLAISREPPGGSSGAGPSGPVIASAKLFPL